MIIIFNYIINQLFQNLKNNISLKNKVLCYSLIIACIKMHEYNLDNNFKNKNKDIITPFSFLFISIQYSLFFNKI